MYVCISLRVPWKPNLGLLQEQQVLLATKPSLQAQHFKRKNKKVCMCAHAHKWRVKGQLVRTGSLLPPCGSRAWWQGPLPAPPSPKPSGFSPQLIVAIVTCIISP